MPAKGKTAAPNSSKKHPPVQAERPDAILADRLQALLAELNMEANRGGPSATESTTSGDTAVILLAIENSRSSLLTRIDKLTEECNCIRADLDKIRGRLTESESRISATEDLTTSHDHRLEVLENTVKSLVAKSDDAENRLRRNNVRVLGLPEGSEGERPAEFAEAFFKDILELTPVSPTYVVERAHRVPTGRRPPGAPPRPFLVRFLNYRDRDRILSEARKHPHLKYENADVHFYPDFSADLQKKRKTFQDIRRRLREKGLPYSMLYPSRLRVVHAGTAKFFDSPEEADSWFSALR